MLSVLARGMSRLRISQITYTSAPFSLFNVIVSITDDSFYYGKKCTEKKKKISGSARSQEEIPAPCQQPPYSLGRLDLQGGRKACSVIYHRDFQLSCFWRQTMHLEASEKQEQCTTVPWHDCVSMTQLDKKAFSFPLLQEPQGIQLPLSTSCNLHKAIFCHRGSVLSD